MTKEKLIPIEVACALPKECVFPLEVPENTTVLQAIQLSGLEKTYPEIFKHLEAGRVGIFGKKVSLETIVTSQDRIEIYRPLIASSKALRNNRLKKTKDSTKV